jgi:hypothetical protein
MPGGSYHRCHACRARTVAKRVRGQDRQVVLDCRLAKPDLLKPSHGTAWTLAPDLSPGASPNATINDEVIPHGPDARSGLIYVEHATICTATQASLL